MNGLQIFAFIVLPVIVAAGGWLAAFAVAPPRRSRKLDARSPSEPNRHPV